MPGSTFPRGGDRPAAPRDPAQSSTADHPPVHFPFEDDPRPHAGGEGILFPFLDPADVASSHLPYDPLHGAYGHSSRRKGGAM